ncbi:MAG: S8 family serine peptidase [Anaerolineae bacterium]
MFSKRRWFIALQGLTIVCIMLALAPQPMLGALPVRNDAPQAENPPPEASPPSAPTPADIETEAGPARPIYLQSRQFTPTTSEVTALQQIASAITETRMHVLVQFDFVPREAAKDALAAEGIELLAYVPDYAWIASVPTNRVADVVDRPGVTWIGQLQVNDKLDPAIVADQWGTYNLTPDGVAAVYVAFHADVSLDAGHTVVAGYGGKITGEVIGINMLMVEMPRENIQALASEDIVQWIEPAAPALAGANDGIRPQIGVDVLQASPYNLDGTGIDALVYDSGQAGDHVDFGSRLTHGDTDVVSTHSTHVAGTLGGDGTNSVAQGGSALQWRGMATNVDLISYGTEGYSGSGYIFYQDVPDIEHDWAQAQNSHGADLGSASLGSNVYDNYYPTGCSIIGKYGAASVLLDQIVRGGNSVVGVGDKYIATWAAGNERGWGSSCAGAGGGYGLVAPPAGAKNPIHVGGSNTNNNTQYAHTSWGPTEDGRIKPIVTAGACQTTGDGGIKSTDDNPVNAYTVMCGTSMATPAVAGGIALMLQHYRDVYNTTGNFWPSTAKAILMQTADDLGNPGPDYQWGFGQVDIHAAVDLISRKAFRQESIAQGEVDVFYFIVPDDATPATVSLAWDDYEATFNANPTLINNLDLELVAPDGTLWRPWVLDPASPASNATRGLDNRNNQEQIQVFATDEAIVGTWLVRVKGTTVPQGPQDYSLVCEGCQPLDLGVCQGEVGGTVTAAANATTATPMSAGLGEDDIEASTELEQPSTGELWQRALEAAAEDPTGELMHQAETQRAWAALEAAQAGGPEAVVALLDTLDAKALDIVIGEIAEAREKLGEATLPPPETGPVSEAEELAILQAQEAIEAANRAQALADFDDPAEGQGLTLYRHSSPSYPAGPAADLTVGNGCTYATIGAAVAVADPGDTLLIEGGRTFTENVTIPISLTLQGGYDGCASGSSARTTIDGNASGSVIYIDPGLTVMLEDLNITNGDSGSASGGGIMFAPLPGSGNLTLTNIDIYANTSLFGGGLWVGPNTEVVGTNVDIYNNTASGYGGGIRMRGGHIIFTSSSIHDNSAPIGGGVYGNKSDIYLPVLNFPSQTDVYNNQALSGDGLGGGVYLQEGTLSMADNSDIYSNDAIQGGGAYLVTSTLTIDGASSWIYSNAATGNGGGVYAQGSSINLDNEAELYDNDAETGGGAYLDDSDLYGDKASIRYNNATQFGAGVYAINGSIVDMDLGNYTCLGTHCSRIYANNTSTYYGGGIYASASTVDLRNTFVEYNAANYGGGVYAYDGTTVYVYNSLFARNVAASDTADAIRLNDADMIGAGNTLAYNDFAGAAAGQAIGLSGTSNLSLDCSIIWAHNNSIDTAGQIVTYSDIEGGYPGTGNLDVNPLFVASGGFDYHLQNTSPVIDRCAYFSGMSTDFDNDSRPVVRITAATPYDMGADEVAGVERVGINGGGCAYATIQQAVNAASDGDTLQVAEGVYFENVDIDKALTIEGGYDSACTTFTGAETRVEGSLGSASAFEVTSDVNVSLHNLRLAWGGGVGGGLQNAPGSQVTLDNVDVLNNHGTFGGGIYVASNSVLTTTNGSEIHHNTATNYGGGGRVWGTFFAYGNDSDIHDNCAPSGGGFSVPQGALYLHDADVYLNDAAAADGKGGGIYVTDGGSVTMTNAAYVYYLNRAFDGGGIYADDASVYMQGTTTTVRDNVAANYGGGVYLGNNSTLRSDGARIGQVGTATIANEAVYGAGLYVITSTVDFSGRIQNNIAAGDGGGILAVNSQLWLEDTTVGGTGTGEANQLGPNGHYGAGLYLNNTHAVLSNTVVASNTFQTAGWTYGGGAYLTNGSVLTLTNSTIERHLAPSEGDGRGAGLYIYDSTATLDNSTIISNTAGAVGGGVRMLGTSTLSVTNGSLIRNNESLNYEGGGIAAGGTPDINIVDSTLQENRAGTDGGAIYLNAGTLDFTGGWTLRSNDADGNGGAVAVVGTADADFNAGAYSLIYDNVAHGGNGGAIYLTNNDTVRLYATSGAQLYIYANAASTNGGALYADNGGYFDIYGQVSLDHNWATSGHGGAIYLSNGSRVWLDDYGAVRPELWDNRAYNGNGGAIYASNSPSVQCDGATLGRIDDGNHAAVDGGALYLSGSTLDADNCLFIDNEAAVNGGAVAAYTSTLDLHANFVASASAAASEPEQRDGLAPVAPAATACDPSLGPCSAFYGNVADSDTNDTGHGGSLYVNDGTLNVSHTHFHHNTAARGGAIYQTGANAVAEIDNTLVYSNTSTTGFGAGIRTENGTFTVTHTTLAHNEDGAGYSQSNTDGYAINSIAWGNTQGGFWVTSGSLAGTCSLDQSNNAGLAADPMFVGPGAGEDYHVLGSSPAINACPTGLTPDLDNVPRPVATAYDMGAYEYPYSVIFAPDRVGDGYIGHEALYSHTLTNTSLTTATFAFDGLSAHGWALTLPSSVTLGSGQSVSVEVSVHVPSNASIGTVDEAVITAFLEGDPTLSAQVTDTTTVICQPISGADFTFVPSPAAVDKPTVFTGIVTAGQLPITYTWNFGDGSGVEIGNPITHTFTTSDTFTVWMTATNACPSVGTAMQEVTAMVTEVYIYLPIVVRNH